MSEGGGSAGPDIGPNYQNSGPASYSNPPSQPPTPSSTVQDPPNYQSNGDIADNAVEAKSNLTNLHANANSGLPPFSSFAASDVTEGLGGRLAGDGYLTTDGISSTRVMELSGWDYCYTDGLNGRYIDRGDSMPVMIPQPQYRPWESKQDGSSDSIKSTLPSFQSQFGEELVTTLTTLTPASCSPAPSVPSPGLPSFHTLSAVNPRYPLVPAPVQAREIPSIQQQFLDERHIHLFQGPPGQNFTLQTQNSLNGQTLTSLNNGTTLTTLNNAQYHPQIINNAQILPSGQILAPQSHILAPSSQIITSNGHLITSSGSQGLTVVSQNSTPTVLTVVKTEPVNIVELKSSSTEPSNLTQLHHTNFQNPMITQQMDTKFGLESPPRGVDGRKKERRKIRASSLESSNESDGAMSVESSGQVAAVSSTAGFKSPMTPGQMNNEDTGEKQTKKKRKRCGECIGCQRKDNCGDCAPCRNDKSHQICKMRRCEKLTEKKHLLAYNREDGGGSYRGRGRGRGRGSRGGYRGKGARPNSQTAQANSATNEMNPTTPGLIVGSNRENTKVDANRVNSNSTIPANPALAPAMAVPFYTTGTEVWSASTPADPWANQGQFIHQIDDIRYQHYPGYQTTGYQQTGFITDQTSAFQPQYTNATNGNPATSPAQGNVTPRPAGNYNQVHTPTPSPNPSTPHVNGHRNGINVHYVEENYVNGTAFATDNAMAPPGSTTPNSRSSSVHIESSETNGKTSGYMSGNEIPGYPLNSPQCQSSCNSSGYPGQSVQSEFGDQTTINGNSYQSSNGPSQGTQKSPSYAQASPGTYHNYQNFNQQANSVEDHQNSVKSSMSPGNCHPPSQKPSGINSQFSPKNFNSNPSPQNYQEVSPGQNRSDTGPPGNAIYENRSSLTNGNIYQSDRFDQQNYQTASPSSQNYGQASPNQEKSNVNARIKSMIMNKQQMTNQTQQQNVPNNNFSASNENQMMSPNREMMSPSHQQQQQHHQQLLSPMMQNSQMTNHQLLSPNHSNLRPNQNTNNQMMSPNGKDSRDYLEKIQHSDYGDRKGQVQMSENGNHHFLAFSHHLQDRSRLQPEGGGVQHWAGNTVSGADYNFQKFPNYREPVSQSRKSKKKKEACASMVSNLANFAEPEHFHQETFSHSGYETNNNIYNQTLTCVNHRDDMKHSNTNRFTNPIRTLEENFPVRRTQVLPGIPFHHSKTTVCGGRHQIPCSESEKFYWSHPNFRDFSQPQNANDQMNNKKTGFIEKRSCGVQNGQGNINFQFFSDVTYGVHNSENGQIKNSNINEPGTMYNNNEGYQKSSFKSEFLFENNEFDQANCELVKAEKDVKPDISVIDALLEKQDLIIKGENAAESLENGNKIEKKEEVSEVSIYPKVLYAPNFGNMKIIDRRFETYETESKINWENYQKDRKGRKNELENFKSENYLFQGEGGPIDLKESTGAWCCRLGGTEPPTAEHLKTGCCQGYQTADEFSPENEKSETMNDSNDVKDCGTTIPGSDTCENSCDKSGSKNGGTGTDVRRDFQENLDRLRNNLRADVPDCKCFPPDKCPPEPGSYYTHLGAAASLSDLRKDLETRTGQTGKALRFEKICYTGKEGKTTQGCPLAKWVIRRSGMEEKILIVVKHRQGHTCSTAWIVVCLVAWEGVPTAEADKVYSLLSHKLNKFGLPTTRRCATNEPRTCACQGLNPDTCGASFSFGCSWSMYYNGCKYARSKTVRKFRLSVRSEEQDVEERMHVLATLLGPLYNTLAPDAFHNQTLFEREATECRLGFKPGRPFSGVTACIDFCAHSHRDLHNMNNGCTVVVTLTKHRSLSKPDDEQLHVLPLYIMDDTDEFGCKEAQEEKCKNGSIECLSKFPCEVRVRAVPLQPCRRHGKKRKDDEVETKPKEYCTKIFSPMNINSSVSPMPSVEMQSIMDLQLQSSQVSSTVLDSPVSGYKQWNFSNRLENEIQYSDERWNNNSSWIEPESQRKQTWLNHAQIPATHWDYSRFTPEGKVNPDSTTNQTCAAGLRRNVIPGMAPYAKYDAGGPVFLKPKHPNEYAFANLPKIKQEPFSGHENYENGNAWFENNPDTLAASGNIFSQNSSYGYSQQKSQLNSRFSSEPKDLVNGSWPGFVDKFPNRDLIEGPGRCNESQWGVLGSNGMHEFLGSDIPKSEPIGEVTDFIENEECFKDSQMGGVAIALGHGSVLFECAKHELHATTALKKPNRLRPTRISLVFYQHRNLNRPKHGWEEWEEKMRLRKLGISVTGEKLCSKEHGKSNEDPGNQAEHFKLAGLEKPMGLGDKFLLRIPTYTTTTWTTLFPMRPCMVTGPYQAENDGEK